MRQRGGGEWLKGVCGTRLLANYFAEDCIASGRGGGGGSASFGHIVSAGEGERGAPEEGTVAEEKDVRREVGGGRGGGSPKSSRN